MNDVMATVKHLEEVLPLLKKFPELIENQKQLKKEIASMRRTINKANPEQPRREENYTIRYKLAKEEDEKKMQQFTPKQVIQKIKATGEAWACLVAGYEYKPDGVSFYMRSREDEKRVRLKAARIPQIFELSLQCVVIESRYYVCALNFPMTREMVPNPREHLAAWSKENQDISIVGAEWKQRSLILALDCREQARQLCKTTVYLNAVPGRVIPFDTRSLPILCYRCQAPGHFKGKCTKPERCGKCAGDHDTMKCDNSGRKKCANCGGPHEAWAPGCEFEATKKMRLECKKWRQQGPSWAINLHSIDLKEQTPQPNEKGPVTKKGSSKQATPRKQAIGETANINKTTERAPEAIAGSQASASGTDDWETALTFVETPGPKKRKLEPAPGRKQTDISSFVNRKELLPPAPRVATDSSADAKKLGFGSLERGASVI